MSSVPATANSISDLEALLRRGDGNDVSNDLVSGNSLGKERGTVSQISYGGMESERGTVRGWEGVGKRTGRMGILASKAMSSEWQTPQARTCLARDEARAGQLIVRDEEREGRDEGSGP